MLRKSRQGLGLWERLQLAAEEDRARQAAETPPVEYNDVRVSKAQKTGPNLRAVPRGIAEDTHPGNIDVGGRKAPQRNLLPQLEYVNSPDDASEMNSQDIRDLRNVLGVDSQGSSQNTIDRILQSDSESNTSPVSNMSEDAVMAPMAVNAGTQTTSSGVNTRNVTKVSNIPPSFPFHNTTQAILQHRALFSANALSESGDTKNVIKVRMNTPVGIYNELPAMVTQVDFNRPVNGLSAQGVGKYQGAYHHKYSAAATQGVFHFDLQPISDLVVLDPETAKLSNMDYYNKIWMAYAVTKVEWKLTVKFPYVKMLVNDTDDGSAHDTTNNLLLEYFQRRDRLDDVKAKAYQHYTVVGDSIGDNNVPDDLSAARMELLVGAWDNEMIISPNSQNSMSGVWYPGKVKHNVLNDSDIDTWTAVGSAPTSGHLEHLVIQFRKTIDSNESTYDFTNVNCDLHLKYHIQFKDLRTNVQWPTTDSEVVVMDVGRQQNINYETPTWAVVAE